MAVREDGHFCLQVDELVLPPRTGPPIQLGEIADLYAPWFRDPYSASERDLHDEASKAPNVRCAGPISTLSAPVWNVQDARRLLD